jgi:hypothetical protein
MQQHARVFGGNIGVAGDKQTANFEVTETRSKMQRSSVADDHKTDDYDAKQKK